MNILLTNHSLMDVGGTEKWTYATAEELLRRGNTVTAYTFMRGITSEKLEHLGVTVTTEPKGDYDLALVNHNTCLGMIQRLDCPKVFTSHGPEHKLEMAALGADHYAAVSLETQGRWAAEGFAPALITNGINLNEFYPVPRNGAVTVLCACKSPDAAAMINEVCYRNGWNFIGRHYTERPEWDMASLMRQADIVVGCGRTAYEALACDKEVFVFDWRRQGAGPLADGWLTEDNIELIRQSNCSGRYHKYRATIKWLLEHMPQRPAVTHWGRAWAEKHANIKDKVEDYLELSAVTETV